MELFFAILFWGCLGILIYIFAGYMLILQLLARLFPYRSQPDNAFVPSVTILFSARNERASLPAKLDSVRNLNYPRDKIQTLVASDASTDGTDEYLAQQNDVQFVALDSHGGKNAALNAILPLAKGEILFFTDANTVFHPDCCKNAVRHFNNSKVGAVAGELVFTQDENWNAVGRGAGLYWKYENKIKQLESRLGSLLVGGGSLLIVRRNLIDSLDPRIANDLEIPIRVGANGYKTLYDMECVGFEKAHSKPVEELGRTSRIVARGFRGFTVLFPELLRNPMRFWQFLSHKFLRWFTLLFCMGTMAGAWGLLDRGFPAGVFYLGVFYLGLAGIAASLIGLIALPFSPASKWARPFTLAAHMLVMHSAALWGVAKALFGQTPATWTVPESTRE